MVRWLGVDPGRARVGLAVSDPEERLAVPLEIVAASAAFPAIRAVVARDGIEGIVIGLARLPSGDEGESARLARSLGERIRRTLGLPVEYEDEAYTSQAAERLVGHHRRSDDLAASIMLQQFLDRRRGVSPPPKDPPDAEA
ncbi:MAG: putative pre-16S rRNA nuclease [Chloroflexota bacterium]